MSTINIEGQEYNLDRLHELDAPTKKQVLKHLANKLGEEADHVAKMLENGSMEDDELVWLESIR